MEDKPKFWGLPITRSIQDRIFLGVMGALFMVPTGNFLHNRWTMEPPLDPGFGMQLLMVFIDEVMLTVFLLATCSFIWGIAAPRWFERIFEHILSKFILVLGLIVLLLLGFIIYLFEVGV